MLTPEERKKKIHSGCGNILIMDDDAGILKTLARNLAKMGYKTSCVQDGKEAIALYREAHQSGQSFHLVFLDLTVAGGMGGAKAMRELFKIDPDVKVVVSSGYANDPIMTKFKDYGFCGVLPKPYTRDQISELLARIFPQN